MIKSNSTSDFVLKPPDSYQMGVVLDGHVAAAKKLINGRRIIRKWVAEKGRSSIYDLTGLIRSFPLDIEDLPLIASQICLLYTSPSPRD